ncbi:MAG TPA: sigma factor-like helix-turn-helix DNA-binding protein [Candidatus Brocadiales bacterium]|nr:sigma factor-like helix-turn-helix DNA-binding protein [Candidatus Brocadiales bacterium]
MKTIENKGPERIYRKNLIISYLYGYTLKDIAERLGVYYATVSRAVKRA